MGNRIKLLDRLIALEEDAPDFGSLDVLTADAAFTERAIARGAIREALARMGVRFDDMGRFAVMAGADPQLYHPLAPPTVSGANITVDYGLQQPTRITKTVMDLTQARFLLDVIFASGGGVTGGAVIFDDLTGNLLYAERDVQKIAPGEEYPLITFTRPTPSVALVDKWGGKFFITDEAKDRNDTVYFSNAIRQMSNTIVRKLNQYAMGLLDAAITAKSRTFTGRSWSAVVTGGAGQTNNTNWPARDLIHAQTIGVQEEMGVEFNAVLLNPIDMENFAVVYGQDAPGVFTRNGFNQVRVSNRVTSGAATFLAAQQAGEMRIEQPLSTKVYREESTDRTWVQTGVRPVAFINNGFAVSRATAIA